MAGTTGNVDYDLASETLNQLGLDRSPTARLLTLLTVLEVLTPKVDASSFSQAQRVVRPAFNLGDLQLLSEEDRTRDLLSPLVDAQLAVSIVTPRIGAADSLLGHCHFHAFACRRFLRHRLFSLLFLLGGLHFLPHGNILLLLGRPSLLLNGLLAHKLERLLLADLDGLRNLLFFRHLHVLSLLMRRVLLERHV